MMTQEEINKMMKEGNGQAREPAQSDDFSLDNTEKDAIGEVSNICMGTCATTLSTLLNKRVKITTPKLTIGKINSHLEEFKTPFIAVEVGYTQGISGYNIFILKQDDVMLMTDLLMGGEGNIEPGKELDELAFSAISEVMNQMVGSSSTALADVLERQINISTPNVKKVELENPDLTEFIQEDDITIRISFVMEIEDLLVSNIMQIIPFESGKEILTKILGEKESRQEEAEAQNDDFVAVDTETGPDLGAAKEKGMVGVKAVQYQSFDKLGGLATGKSKENMGLIMEVPLHVTVELGSCKKSIKEILSFTSGSVVVLNRMAGEMVDIMVNGVLFAIGEVVVIDDNYGVRITEIVNQPNE
jgi:flagellar motor switch protein FliN/FliY